MAARKPTFTAIPSIPTQGLSNWQYSTLTAMKENVELLMGARGKAASSVSAITRGAVTADNAPTQNMRQVTADGSGFTISGVTVPSLDDYTKLVGNVQQLADDVAALRNTVNTLINQLKG